jgi:hypothetical protein
MAQPAHPGAASLALALDLLHRSLKKGNEAEIRDRLMEIASNDWAEIEIDLRDGRIGLTPTTSSDGAQSRW